jgi:hypothetical protein
MVLLLMCHLALGLYLVSSNPRRREVVSPRPPSALPCLGIFHPTSFTSIGKSSKQWVPHVVTYHPIHSRFPLSTRYKLFRATSGRNPSQPRIRGRALSRKRDF